jgi:hypothetical protein
VITPGATPASGSAEAPDASEQTFFPDVVAARATQQADGTWRFDVTLSSPYDSPDRYADAWRVLGPDGTELGVRVLTHDHASEQPFTRSLAGVEIPAAVSTVTIQGRDRVSGWGGATVEIELPGRQRRDPRAGEGASPRPDR